MDRKLNKKKVTIAILILILIIFTIILTILYRKNTNVRSFLDKYLFRKNITENTLPKIPNENTNFFAFNDTIVGLNNNTLSFYNSSANKISSIEIDISDPIFVAKGKYLCIAEKNGKKAYLISNKNIVWQKDIDGKISNISINKNGYVSISISDTNYRTICKMYSNKGDELFTTYLAKTYIIDSSISDDNKYLALAETNVSGIAVQSNIKIISIDKALSGSSDTISYSYSAPVGDLIVNIDYCSGNNLVCLYDNHISLIKDNSVTEISNLTDSNYLFADINNKLVQIEKIKTGMVSSNLELQTLGIPNLEKKTYSIKKEPKSMVAFGNIIAINFGTEALFINNSGWLIKNYTSSQEIQSITISNNLAGIIFNDKIEILSL